MTPLLWQDTKWARINIGTLEFNSDNIIERAVKHWKIVASAGEHRAMHELRIRFEQGRINRETINIILAPR
jgi:hypothetical protein